MPFSSMANSCGSLSTASATSRAAVRGCLRAMVDPGWWRVLCGWTGRGAIFSQQLFGACRPCAVSTLNFLWQNAGAECERAVAYPMAATDCHAVARAPPFGAAVRKLAGSLGALLMTEIISLRSCIHGRVFRLFRWATAAAAACRYCNGGVVLLYAENWFRTVWR